MILASTIKEKREVIQSKEDSLELINTGSAVFCSYFKDFLDTHLATKLGEQMRTKLEGMKKEIEETPEKFVEKKKVYYESIPEIIKEELP